MASQIFKATDSLWLLNDGGKLITFDPPDGDGRGFVGFIALEEATIFLADSDWDKNLMAAKCVLEQFWTVETLPIYVLTPMGHDGFVSVQMLTKEALCGK